jgi:NADH-quinone oxidoreductase subunit C
MAKVSNEELLAQLTAKLGDVFTNEGEPFGLLTIETSRDNITKLLTVLKSELNFIHLTDITAIHYPEKEKQFEVVYHVHNLAGGVRIRVKVALAADDVHIPTAVDTWAGANWMERETYDFFGIIFDGHPDLRRILNVDDMTVFPMRREYPLEDPNRIDKKDYFFGR